MVRFGADIVEDEQGYKIYRLCAQRQRHYKVKYKKGEPHIIAQTFTPCDGACAGGKLYENSEQGFLLLVGIYKRLPKDEVLVVVEADRYGYLSYCIWPSGFILDSGLIARGIVLKNGQTMQVKRTLPFAQRINLTPANVRFSRNKGFRGEQELIISEIVDTIRNVDGKALIENNEAELRTQAKVSELEYYDMVNKEDDERKKRQKDFGRKMFETLRTEYGFSYQQAQGLMNAAKPGQCLEAIEKYREAVKSCSNDILDERLDLDDIDYEPAYFRRYKRGEMIRQEFIRAGVIYIASIGGVPADKSKVLKPYG